MNYQVKKPKTAQAAIRYFHAVALDYVADLKKQFPNHDISIEPSELPYSRQLSQLNINIQVWDRRLLLAFEMFTEPKKDEDFRTSLMGKGVLQFHPHFDYLLYVLPHGNNEWLYWRGAQDRGTLDADFLREQMRLLLDQLPS